MASDRKLIVSIIGDDSSLQTALTRATASTAKFGKAVQKNLRPTAVSSGASFAPLLDDIRRMKDEADGLSKRLTDIDTSASGAGDGVGKFALKAGLATVAIGALYQASQTAQRALKVTGAEAFKTEGRLRNFGAALLGGDIIGGFQAIAAQPKTFEDLGISITEARNRLGEFQRLAKLGLGGGSQLAQDVVNLIASIDALANAEAALADHTARLGSTFRTASGDVVAFKGAVDDAAGARGTGGVEAINRALELASGATSGRLRRPIGPTAKNANAQILAAANEDLQELLRLQVVERERLAKAVQNATGNVKQREALAREFAQAQATVVGTERQIAANAEAASEARRRAAEAARRDAETAERERIARAKEAASRLKAIREQAAAAEQARQFRAIGLSATGNAVTPTVENLRKQFESLSERVVGEDVSRNLRDRLKAVGRFFASGVKEIKEPTRAAIRDLFEMIRAEFDKGTKKGPLTATSSLNANKILDGLGLGREAEKELRARLSSFNSAGRSLGGATRPTGNFSSQPVQVTVNTTTTLDGEVVNRNQRKYNQKQARRNPRQKRGPNSRSGI